MAAAITVSRLFTTFQRLNTHHGIASPPHGGHAMLNTVDGPRSRRRPRRRRSPSASLRAGPGRRSSRRAAVGLLRFSRYMPRRPISPCRQIPRRQDRKILSRFREGRPALPRWEDVDRRWQRSPVAAHAVASPPARLNIRIRPFRFLERLRRRAIERCRACATSARGRLVDSTRHFQQGRRAKSGHCRFSATIQALAHSIFLFRRAAARSSSSPPAAPSRRPHITRAMIAADMPRFQRQFTRVYISMP